MTISLIPLTRAARCPCCGDAVCLAGRPLIGEICGCDRCGTQLEVASIDPLMLELLAKVDEDEGDFIS